MRIVHQNRKCFIIYSPTGRSMVVFAIE